MLAFLAQSAVHRDGHKGNGGGRIYGVVVLSLWNPVGRSFLRLASASCQCLAEAFFYCPEEIPARNSVLGAGLLRLERRVDQPARAGGAAIAV